MDPREKAALSPSLGTMFADFERDAFRLETLDDYSQSGGVDAYRAFLAGKPQPEDYKTAEWMTTVQSAVQAGKRIYRVHVLSLPLTDYLRFELSWGYRRNMMAGEEFYILDTTHRPNPVADAPDFWLFDDKTTAVMNYDSVGKYINADFYTGGTASRFRSYRDLALAHAVPFSDWWAEFGG